MKTQRIGLVASLIFLVLDLVAGQGRASAGPEGPVWPAPPATARIAYLKAFSSPEDLGVGKAGPLRLLGELLFGKEPRTLDQPFAIAVSDRGTRIFVSDTALGAVHAYDLTTGKYELLRRPGAEGFTSPVGLALSKDGRLFVADSTRAEIQVYDARLKPLFTIGKDQGLVRPTGLAVGGSVLYVADSSLHVVIAFELRTDSARELFRIGGRGRGPGLFNFPVDLAVAANGSLYVNDSMNFRVQCFDTAGRYLSSFGRAGGASGQLQRSKGLGLDGEGQVYVVDALADTVQVFDQAGRFLINFGAAGSGPGEFWLPSGLAIDGFNRVYVVDSYNKRVQMFQYLNEGGLQ